MLPYVQVCLHDLYNFYYSRYALYISSTNIGLKIIIVFRLAVVYNTNKIISSSLNFNFVGIVTIYLSFSLFLSFFFLYHKTNSIPVNNFYFNIKIYFWFVKNRKSERCSISFEQALV